MGVLLSLKLSLFSEERNSVFTTGFRFKFRLKLKFVIVGCPENKAIENTFLRKGSLDIICTKINCDSLYFHCNSCQKANNSRSVMYCELVQWAGTVIIDIKTQPTTRSSSFCTFLAMFVSLALAYDVKIFRK